MCRWPYLYLYWVLCTAESDEKQGKQSFVKTGAVVMGKPRTAALLGCDWAAINKIALIFAFFVVYLFGIMLELEVCR